MSRFGKAAKKLSVAGFRPARPIDGEFHEHNYAGATPRQLVAYCSICFIAGMAFAVGLGGLLLVQTGHRLASAADKKVIDAAATAGVDLSLMTVGDLRARLTLDLETAPLWRRRSAPCRAMFSPGLAATSNKSLSRSERRTSPMSRRWKTRLPAITPNTR